MNGPGSAASSNAGFSMHQFGIPIPQPLSVSGGELTVTAWRQWRQVWDAYAVLTELAGKPAEYQASMLLTCIGKDALAIVNSLPYNQEADRKNAEKILELLEKRCTETENVTYERFKFYSRNQTKAESIDTFTTDLRTLAATCNFKESGTDLTKQMIRDRIICGVQNEGLRRRLLTEKDVSLDDCVAECRTTEATAAQAFDMRAQAESAPADSDSVFTTDKWSRGPSRRRFSQTMQNTIRDCKYCGSDHLLGMRNCPAYGKKCNRCGRENHFAFKCREMSSKQRMSGYNRTSSRGQVYQIEEEETNCPSRHDHILTIEEAEDVSTIRQNTGSKGDARYSPGWNWENRTVDG